MAPTLDDLARLHAAAGRAGFEMFERDRLDAGEWAEETRFALGVIERFADDEPSLIRSAWRRIRFDEEVRTTCARIVDREKPHFRLRLVVAWHLTDRAFAERVAAEQAVLPNDRLDELASDYVAVALHWLVREWYWPTTSEGANQ